MNTNPCILILCGGKEAVPGIKNLSRLGFRTIVVDGNQDAPGRNVADVFVKASIYNPNEVIKALQPIWNQLNVSGVITIAADNPTTVAAVGERFGVRTLSARTAELSTNKLKMKEVLRDSGILIPWFSEICNLEQLQNLLKERPAQYVLKPIDSRGSRGVIRIASVDECFSAYEYSSSYTATGKLIVEEWIEGDQLSSESIVWKGKAHLCGLADRNYGRLEELYPYVVEDGGQTPSVHCTTNAVSHLDDIMSQVAAAIGLSEGSIKGDIIYRDGLFYVIEVASRLSGGSFSTITIPLVHKYDLIGNVARMAIGEAPELPQRPLIAYCFQANRFAFPEPGKLKYVGFEAPNDPNVIDCGVALKSGDEVLKVLNHTMRPGWALVCGKSRSEAIKLAESCISGMVFDVCRGGK